jgi:predicted acyltransferase
MRQSGAPTATNLDYRRLPLEATQIPTVSSRVMSVDALRGFDMFWIIGAEEVFEALGKWLKRDGFYPALNHADWAGFHFYDLIFPLFVFIIGVSIVFSLTKAVANEGRAGATFKILRRSLILYLLGIFHYGAFNGAFDHIRLLGVLQRLAICYCFAGLAFVWLRPRTMVILCAGLLIGYWAMMTFIPVPGVGAGNYAEGKNLANWLDKMYLPWRKWDGDHDPEGYLSNLPAIASCLLGVFAGLLLKNPRVTPQRKTILLLAWGAAGIVAGLLWGIQFPIIKKIWTSSFVLFTAGMSAILLAIFYWVIDVKNYRAWSQPFVWIGMNAITIYVIRNVVPFEKIAERFAGGDVEKALDRRMGAGFGEVVLALISLALSMWLVWFLYRRKIFLKV